MASAAERGAAGRPSSGRAAVYAAPNAPFEIREYPLRPPGPGELLVRVSMSTICRSDIHSYQGRRPNPCPGILGHEIIGRVIELGQGVQTDLRGDPVRPGDRITWTEYFHHGASVYRDLYDMPQKCRGVEKYGHESADQPPHLIGGFADHCYVLPGTGLLRLPEELSDEEATPLNCGVATMVAVTEAAGIGVGDSVVIQGLGLLGLYGAALAKARGARLVVGIDPVAARRALAGEFGVDLALDPAQADRDLVAQVRAACKPDGADAVIEVCGSAAVIEQGLRLLRVGGRYVLGGVVTPGANATLDFNLVLRQCLTLRGVHNYHPRHLVQALDFVVSQRARFPFCKLVDARYPLAEVDRAFADAAACRVLRAAIVP
jgi:putative phosphonate catabolism associated alcohol dehydrogenase